MWSIRARTSAAVAPPSSIRLIRDVGVAAGDLGAAECVPLQAGLVD